MLKFHSYFRPIVEYSLQNIIVFIQKQRNLGSEEYSTITSFFLQPDKRSKILQTR